MGIYACDSGSSGGSLATGSCDYTNEVSSEPECKEYSGIAWTAESAEMDCMAIATSGMWLQNTECALTPTLGTCSVPDFSGEDMEYVIKIKNGGSDPADCDIPAIACAGTFTPSDICASS